MIYLQLFWEFFKAGLFSIGGGLATLPFLQRMGAAYGWFTEGELADMLAVSESTPGPIGINMATYAGIKASGDVLGGLIATAALVLPSLLVMLLVAGLLRRFRQNRFVQGSLAVIRPASVGLIAAVALSVLRLALLSGDDFPGTAWYVPVWPAVLLFAVLALARWRWKRLHPIVFVLIGAAAGILLRL